MIRLVGSGFTHMNRFGIVTRYGHSSGAGKWMSSGVTTGPFSEATSAQFRERLVDWITSHQAELTPPYEDHGSTSEILLHQRHVQRQLYEDGWMRYGWSQALGGYGGSPLFRAIWEKNSPPAGWCTARPIR